MAVDTESELIALEEEFPKLAAHAFLEARDKALAAGLSVVYTEGDSMYELFPDGHREFIKHVPAPRYRDKSIPIRLR